MNHEPSETKGSPELGEFSPGDVIVQIGHFCIGEILSRDATHYFIRWRDSGDSMLWRNQVDKDFVRA